jgi:integrase
MRLYKRGRIWWAQYYQDGKRQQKSTRCRDYTAAQAVARRFERDAADPVDATQAAATVHGALNLLLDNRTDLVQVGKRSPDTLAYYKIKVGHLDRLLGALSLRTLHARDVDDYIAARRRESHAKETTIAKELGALGAALKLAKRAGLWTGDLGAVMPVGFSPEYKPRSRALSPDEVRALLVELAPDRAAHVAFIGGTGASWRESVTARREDVGAWSVLLRGTKRSTRWRVVPLVTAEQIELVLFACEHGEGADGLLFRPWTGVGWALRSACKRAGIAHATPNDLRRTYGSRLRAGGVAPDVIGAAMGHSDSRMVERVYGRLPVDALAGRLAATVAPTSQPGAAPLAAGRAMRRPARRFPE